MLKIQYQRRFEKLNAFTGVLFSGISFCELKSMNKLNLKLELAANVLIIVTAILLVGVIVQRYFLDKSTAVNQQARVQPTVGKQVNLPDENWSAQPKTVVLALQTTCRFCHESAPFYKRLIESAKGKNIKFVAVFPQTVEESTAHLNQLGLIGLEVKQVPISQLDASGTPTLILTNGKGEVTNYWVGKLTPDKETEVINKVNS